MKISVSLLTWIDGSCVAFEADGMLEISFHFGQTEEDIILVFGGYTPLRFSAVA